MGTVAWSVGSDRPEPPPVSPSKYETSARSTSLRPSIAIAKYGPLRRRHGYPITSATAHAPTPPASAAVSHGQPAFAMRIAAGAAPAPENATGPEGRWPG